MHYAEPKVTGKDIVAKTATILATISEIRHREATRDGNECQNGSRNGNKSTIAFCTESLSESS